MQSYGPIVALWTDLLKKRNFVWNLKAIEAFEELKRAMVSTPVLTLPDFSDILIVETDASDCGIGVVMGLPNGLGPYTPK